MTKPPIYDPLFHEQPPVQYLTTAADSTRISAQRVPRSPLSNTDMQLIDVGPFGQPPFKAWVHLTDRIVLPYREGN